MKMLMMMPVLFGLLTVLPAAAQTQQGMDPQYPTTVSNSNIWKLYQDYQVMIEEIDKALSKSNSGLLSHDATRWNSYIANMRKYVSYWEGQAFLDLPVTHGRDWPITGPLNPPCDFKDNTSVCELQALLIGARDELVLSASAELPMHLYPQDQTRQATYWTAAEGYIAFLIEQGSIDEPVTAAEENLGLTPGAVQ